MQRLFALIERQRTHLDAKPVYLPVTYRWGDKTPETRSAS
jgi:hypothetical protein